MEPDASQWSQKNDKKEWAETEIHKIPFKRKKFHLNIRKKKKKK